MLIIKSYILRSSKHRIFTDFLCIMLSTTCNFPSIALYAQMWFIFDMNCDAPFVLGDGCVKSTELMENIVFTKDERENGHIKSICELSILVYLCLKTHTHKKRFPTNVINCFIQIAY